MRSIIAAILVTDTLCQTYLHYLVGKLLIRMPSVKKETAIPFYLMSTARPNPEPAKAARWQLLQEVRTLFGDKFHILQSRDIILTQPIFLNLQKELVQHSENVLCAQSDEPTTVWRLEIDKQISVQWTFIRETVSAPFSIMLHQRSEQLRTNALWALREQKRYDPMVSKTVLRSHPSK